MQPHAEEPSRLEELRDIRDQLKAALGEAPVAVKAQVAGQLMKVLAEIEALESASPEVSESDSIRAELAAGLAESGVVELASRRRKPKAG